jgi:predicted CXXCH cytochrome family protein
MKKTIVVVALAFVLLNAGAALAAITGSKHDMRTHLTVVAGQGYDEVCVYCHTPHSAYVAQPLWNKTNSTNQGSYVPYTSSTMNVTPTGTIGASSLLCMSCHDGSIAVDSMVNAPNNIPGGQPGDNSANLDINKKLYQGNGFLGTSLANDHPVGFDYNTSYNNEGGATGGLVLTATVQGYTAVRLFGSMVECATCHDAHSQTNTPFLRSTNQGSQLCLQCHLK